MTLQIMAASRFICLTFLMALPSFILAAENQYSVGHGALDVFNKDGFLATPRWVQIWVVMLISTFVIGFYFAWKHPLARWAVGGFILSMTMGHTVFGWLNLPFLGGSIAIMHLLCWSPALFALLLKRPFLNVNERTPFRIWSAAMVSVLVFSFIFDIRDAAIYLQHISG